MPERFFDKFPTIVYANTVCRDLTKRVTIRADVKTNIDLYYPLEITAGFRADQVSDAYYEDEELDWLVFMMNDVVDPYYEWYISEIDFHDFISVKYGSVANSQEQILYYRNNWYADEVELNPQSYEDHIDMSWRKYYEPVWSPTNKIYSYRRKQEDWVVNTNRILEYQIDLANSEVTFANSEIVDIKYQGEIIGGGTVIVSNTTVLFIHHVSGNTSANTTHAKTIIGETTGANAATSNVTTRSENFTVNESRFWSAVSHYDRELERYESRKNVEVINSDMIYNVVRNVRSKLQET